MSELELEHICLRKALAEITDWALPRTIKHCEQLHSARRVLNYIKTREEHHGMRPSDIVDAIVAA